MHFNIEPRPNFAPKFSEIDVYIFKIFCLQIKKNNNKNKTPQTLHPMDYRTPPAS